MALSCRPKCSFKPLSVRMRRDFSWPVLSDGGVDYMHLADRMTDSQTKCKFCIKTKPCMEYDKWEAVTLT